MRAQSDGGGRFLFLIAGAAGAAGDGDLAPSPGDPEPLQSTIYKMVLAGYGTVSSSAMAGTVSSINVMDISAHQNLVLLIVFPPFVIEQIVRHAIVPVISHQRA